MGELTIGSLFSGIGGLELGLERAGMRTVWQVETDDYASKILERHWPDALRFGDVREVGSHNLPPVDLICGGFPCQDISVAGKGAGLAGERSGLWSEFARIVRELRPRYVVVENVAALLARGMGVVLGDLAACGYDAEWDCIPAAAVGAHHRRDRLFIVAYSQRDTLREQPVCELGSHGALVSGGNGAPRTHPHTDRERLAAGPQLHSQQKAGREIPDRDDADRLHHPLANTDQPRLEERPIFGGDAREELQAAFRGGRDGGIWAAEPDVGRVAARLSAGLDGGVDEAHKECIQKASATGVPQTFRLRALRGHLESTKASPRHSRCSLCGHPLSAMPCGGGCTPWALGAGAEAGEDVRCLQEGLLGLLARQGEDVWALVPLGPGSHQRPQTMGARNDRLRCLGNAVVPQVAEFIGRRIVAMETRHAA